MRICELYNKSVLFRMAIIASVVIIIIVGIQYRWQRKNNNKKYAMYCEIMCLDDTRIFVSAIDGISSVSPAYNLLCTQSKYNEVTKSLGPDEPREYTLNTCASVLMWRLKKLPSATLTIHWGYMDHPQDVKEDRIHWECVPFEKELALYFIFYQGKWHIVSQKRLNGISGREAYLRAINQNYSI